MRMNGLFRDHGDDIFAWPRSSCTTKSGAGARPLRQLSVVDGEQGEVQLLKRILFDDRAGESRPRS